jgi:hypothetical protein
MRMLEYLIEANDIRDGTQLKFKFDNGYGASVVRHKGSYGYRAGCWEIAVLNKIGKIDYTTDLTDDTIGWVKPEKIEHWLLLIADLKITEKYRGNHEI